MIINTVAKVSIFAVALGFACLLPATARAQSDVMPDSFAFSAEETVDGAAGTAYRSENSEGRFSGQSFATLRREVRRQESESGAVSSLSEVGGNEPSSYPPRQRAERERPCA